MAAWNPEKGVDGGMARKGGLKYKRIFYLGDEHVDGLVRRTDDGML